jgi:hypothetical protein
MLHTLDLGFVVVELPPFFPLESMDFALSLRGSSVSLLAELQ